MSRSVAEFIIILLIYTSDGIPLGERPRSSEIKYGYLAHYIPSQWGKDSEMSYHWPKGEVPYFFDSTSYDDMLKDKVRISMASLEHDSCIRFKEQKEKPTTNGSSWLHFTNKHKQRPCFHRPSYRASGEIEVILGYDCLKQGEIMHAVLHGIGFRDEVSHPQRDVFVKILWGNIRPVNRILFRIQPVERPAGLLEYDPKSIMHFHDHAFSVNGQATINPLLPGLKISPSDHLSHLDKMKLGIMFGHECNRRKVGEVLDTCQGLFSGGKKSEISNDTKVSQKSETNDDDQKNGTSNVVLIVGNAQNEDPPNEGGESDKRGENKTNDSNEEDPNEDNDDGKQQSGNEDENGNENVVVIAGYDENEIKNEGGNNDDLGQSTTNDPNNENTENVVVIAGYDENEIKNEGGNSDDLGQSTTNDPNNENTENVVVIAGYDEQEKTESPKGGSGSDNQDAPNKINAESGNENIVVIVGPDENEKTDELGGSENQGERSEIHEPNRVNKKDKEPKQKSETDDGYTKNEVTESYDEPVDKDPSNEDNDSDNQSENPIDDPNKQSSLSNVGTEDKEYDKTTAGIDPSEVPRENDTEKDGENIGNENLIEENSDENNYPEKGENQIEKEPSTIDDFGNGDNQNKENINSDNSASIATVIIAGTASDIETTTDASKSGLDSKIPIENDDIKRNSDLDENNKKNRKDKKKKNSSQSSEDSESSGDSSNN